MLSKIPIQLDSAGILNFFGTKKRVFISVFFAILFLFIHFSVLFTLQVIWKIEITGWFDHDDTVKLYWKPFPGVKNFSEKYSKESKVIKAGQISKISFNLYNKSMHSLRLDMGNKIGRSKIYSIRIISRFTKNKEYAPKDIFALFKATGPNTTIKLETDHVALLTDRPDPQLVYTGKYLVKPGIFHLYLLPLIFLIVVYLMVFKSNVFSNFIKENIWIRSAETRNYINTLDGLRGIAALMVIADHTMIQFRGVGASGVWIFFTLSGFLITKPFAEKPELIHSFPYLVHYFERRLFRIIPMYFFYITLVFGVTQRWGEAIRHYLFLQGNGHLWAIPQEVLFYLSAPLIVGISYFFFRKNLFFVILFLIIITILVNNYLTRQVFSLLGMDYKLLRFYLGVFLCGMCFSYFHFGFINRLIFSPRNEKIIRYLLNITIVGILIFFCLFSRTAKMVYAHYAYAWFGFLAALVVWAVSFSKNSFVGKCLSWTPLRSIGIVGLSVYLIHPLVIATIKHMYQYLLGYRPYGWIMFLTTVIISIPISFLTYSLVEKPFIFRQQTLHTSSSIY